MKFIGSLVWFWWKCYIIIIRRSAVVYLLFYYNAGSLTIGPRFGNLLGGTAVHLTGPCFSRSNTIRCTFEDRQETTGTVLNNRTAICISPTFNSAGWKQLDLAVLQDDEEIYSGNSRFYAGIILND